MIDEERCYRAVQSRDPRFDGWFCTAVVTTGIYCRPSCPALTPRRANVRFYPSSAAAHGAGFRACKRCRPDAAPGSPEWSIRADVVARAMRLIADGVVDRGGVGGLAGRLGYSGRQLHRLLVGELGAGPLALARAQRAQTARVLLETTSIPITDVAFAAGFASLRQFNDTIRAVFGATPTAVRTAGAGRVGGGAGGRGPAGNGAIGPPAAAGIRLRLAYRRPFESARLFRFLAARAAPGVEAGGETSYRRTLLLPHGGAVLRLDRADDHVQCTLHLDDLRDLNSAVQRCRRLLDLDADPEAVDSQLGCDPLLGPLVAHRPGLRAPGHVDPSELALRTVLGQQVSVAGARTVAGRLARSYGEPLPAPVDGLTHRFPTVAKLAEADPDHLPLPRARARALVGLARVLASGAVVLDPGADRDETSARLLELGGIGLWTVAAIRLRGLGDPDVFLPTDLGVGHALRRLGATGAPDHRWRPWRSYALHHLWSSLEPEPNRKDRI